MRPLSYLALGALFLAFSSTADAAISLDFALNSPSSDVSDTSRELSAGESFDVDVRFSFTGNAVDLTFFDFDVALPTGVVGFDDAVVDNTVRPPGFIQTSALTFDMGLVERFTISDPLTGNPLSPVQDFVVGTISLTALDSGDTPLVGDLTFTNVATDVTGGLASVTLGTGTLTVAAVPEPSSLAAIMLAFGAISVRRRRQN